MTKDPRPSEEPAPVDDYTRWLATAPAVEMGSAEGDGGERPNSAADDAIYADRLVAAAARQDR